MSSDNTDVQRFDRDGIWVKPRGAVSVDITLKGGDGGPGVRAIPARALTFIRPGGGQGEWTGGTVTAGSGGVCMAGAGGGGGTGGAVVAEVGPQASEHGWAGSDGTGELVTLSYAASDLPDEIPIRGKGGEGSGYALIVTRFA